jgi:hypothetical protein
MNATKRAQTQNHTAMLALLKRLTPAVAATAPPAAAPAATTPATPAVCKLVQCHHSPNGCITLGLILIF